jgi:hypothetical protein
MIADFSVMLSLSKHPELFFSAQVSVILKSGSGL